MTAATEAQAAIRDAATDLFGRRVTPERLEKVAASDDRFDRELWSALAESQLLGTAVPEASGGLGLGAVEVALVLEQLGRVAAPVPCLPTMLTAAAMATFGDSGQRDRWLPRLLDGTAVAAIATPSSTVGVRLQDERLSGQLVGVPWAHVADVVVLTVDGTVFLLATDGLDGARGVTTGGEIALDLDLDAVPVDALGDDTTADWLRHRMFVALAAVQAGVTDAAVRMAADYTSHREQFGKPLSTFQAVALKAADAYLDATVIRATCLQAASSLDQDDDPTLPVLTAAWWAAEGGQHCVHLTQHLHGGMGADVTYPVHRYFLWGKQIELLLGGASALLEELGAALESRPDAGDAIVID